MILSKKQRAIALEQREKLRAALSELESAKAISPEINVTFLSAQKKAVRSKIIEIDKQIDRFDLLSSGKVSHIKVEALSDIGVALIEARIAGNLTQKALGERIGVAEQQIQRYEATKYQSASLEKMQKIADGLQSLSVITLTLPSGAVGHQPFDVNELPWREMSKRGWLKGRSAPLELAAASYVNRHVPNGFGRSLNRMRVRNGGKYDPYAMLAWKARVLDHASSIEAQIPKHDCGTHFNFSALIKISGEPNGITKAVRFVRDSGIALVFEPHLPKTHLDGAALLAPWGRPVIGLTLRHDREDNFWFTLMHELAHVHLHRDAGLREGFFDDQSFESEEKVEREADDFALNAMIPNEVWENALVRFTNRPDAVVKFASKLGISAAIVAGRIRSERSAWKKFHRLVGSGAVRSQLTDAGFLEV